jgi:tetratricopeptide (TPR) repeat protein
MDEDLIEAFDNFVIGNYQQCINLHLICQPSSDFSKFLWDAIVARSYLAMGNMDKVKELARSNSASPAVASTGFFAVFSRSAKESPQRKMAMEKINEVVTSTNGGEPVSNYYRAIAIATIDLIDAFNFAKSVAGSSPAEFTAIQANFALAMNRPDLALKTCNELSADDSAAAKLIAALVNLFTNKPLDGYMCYSDLIAQFGTSAILANGRAAANIQRGLYTEAQEDLDNVSLSEHADTLANLVCCFTHQGKVGEANERFEKLAQIDPSHALVMKERALRAAFVNFA